MGTGKTITGRVLAKRLGRLFIDVDRKIEHMNEMSISDIFDKFGEKSFRQAEEETIAKVSKYTNTVIATGGGAVLSEENLIKLRNNGIIISLTAVISAILERTGKRRGVWPLLDSVDFEAAVVSLLEKRSATI